MGPSFGPLPFSFLLMCVSKHGPVSVYGYTGYIRTPDWVPDDFCLKVLRVKPRNELHWRVQVGARNNLFWLDLLNNKFILREQAGSYIISLFQESCQDTCTPAPLNKCPDCLQHTPDSDVVRGPC